MLGGLNKIINFFLFVLCKNILSNILNYKIGVNLCKFFGFFKKKFMLVFCISM